VLERRNKLAQHVSTLTARETGRWSVFNDKKAKASAGDAPPAAPAEPVKVEVDLDELARFVELEDQRYAQFNRRIAEREGVMHVNTEDLETRFADVLDFLEVDVTPELRVVRGRQNPSALSARVRNWDQVVEWLARNGHPEWADT
jgi:hypothetical protein